MRRNESLPRVLAFFSFVVCNVSCVLFRVLSGEGPALGVVVVMAPCKEVSILRCQPTYYCLFEVCVCVCACCVVST